MIALALNLTLLSGRLQDPFSVLTERFDPVNHVISAVTLKGHPLAGWRYWRVYSIGTNDVVVETGAYDQPGPGLKNYAGYYIAQGVVSRGWKHWSVMERYFPPRAISPGHFPSQRSATNGSAGLRSFCTDKLSLCVLLLRVRNS